MLTLTHMGMAGDASKYVLTADEGYEDRFIVGVAEKATDDNAETVAIRRAVTRYRKAKVREIMDRLPG